MSETGYLYSSAAMISQVPYSSAATHVEREIRRLLSLNTPADTACALQKLRDMENHSRRAEWHFLMGICALRRGYVADAQAYLDHACMLCPVDSQAEHEYRTLYASVRNAVEMRRHSKQDEDGQRQHCFSGIDCLDCCDCFDCCDCDHSGGICDCCDCNDGCN